MYVQVEKQKWNKNRVVDNSVTQKRSNRKQVLWFMDNRLEGITQRKLDDDQIGDAWEKVEKYARKKGVELNEEQNDEIQEYFDAYNTPNKAISAMPGARELIDSWVEVEVEDVEFVPVKKWSKKQSNVKMGKSEREKRKRKGHGMMSKEQARRYVPNY